jgi:hypothetical protein
MGVQSVYWQAFRLIVGVLLLFAGAMKLTATSAPQYLSEYLILDSHSSTLLAGWEILLGLWVLSGWSAYVSRRVVAITFSVLASVSGYLGWFGVADCGCFGDVSVSPWWVFGLDVGIVIASCSVKPPVRRATDWAATDFAAPAGVGLALIAIAYFMSVWVYGSLDVAIARLRGEVIRLALG